MKFSFIAIALTLSATTASASVFDGIIPDAYICRDSFLSMMNESTAGSELRFKKQFKGINDKTKKACVINIQFIESDHQEGAIYLEIPNSEFFPFNHYVMSSNDGCRGADTLVKGRNSFRLKTGWRNRFTTKLSIEKLGNGKLQVNYSEEGADTLTCTGTVAR